MKTLVVGLGNPILGDDGVGWQIASELQKIKKLPADVTVENLAVGGITLMETLIGYDRAIIIDSIVTHRNPIGKVSRYQLEELPNTTSGHMNSAHDASLTEALEMGRALGAYLPDQLDFVTVEAQKVFDFSEELSPAVAASIPEAVRIIMDLLLESTSKQAPEIIVHKG